MTTAAPAPMGLPPLSLSTGPAVSEAAGSASGTTGPFHFNSKPQGGLERYAPWAIAGVALWFILKRR